MFICPLGGLDEKKTAPINSMPIINLQLVGEYEISESIDAAAFLSSLSRLLLWQYIIETAHIVELCMDQQNTNFTVTVTHVAWFRACKSVEMSSFLDLPMIESLNCHERTGVAACPNVHQTNRFSPHRIDGRSHWYGFSNDSFQFKTINQNKYIDFHSLWNDGAQLVQLQWKFGVYFVLFHLLHPWSGQTNFYWQFYVDSINSMDLISSRPNIVYIHRYRNEIGRRFFSMWFVQMSTIAKIHLQWIEKIVNHSNFIFMGAARRIYLNRQINNLFIHNKLKTNK